MIRARLTVRTSGKRAARALVEAVHPDNLNMAGLNIVGRAHPRSARFELSFRGRLETFIFTLDDLLRCLQAAKKTLDNLAEKLME